MTTLYPNRRTGGITWRDFNGAYRYFWTAGHYWNNSSFGDLWDKEARDVNTCVTLEQAERSLRQLGHQIGEWDD